MPGPADPVFDDPRLAVLYDPLDADRSDLDAYLAMVDEFGAQSVLDVGCGTGTLACLLALRGVDVIAVDPAVASLDVARAKPGAERVRWLHLDATTLPPLAVDMAVMTGNVAQVFLIDGDWVATLLGVHGALRPGGSFVFETRDPARRAWERWTREHTWSRDEVSGVGIVENWADVVEVRDGFVTFRWTFRFETTGEVITSDSTLRFRERSEIEHTLASAGLRLVDVRDAPDRPGLEWVFVTERAWSETSLASAPQP